MFDKKKWLELMKNHDICVLYNPGNANVVVDYLSQMSMGSVVHVPHDKKELVNKVHKLVPWEV